MGGAGDLVHEDVDGLSFAEGRGVLASDGGHVAGGVGGVERAVALGAALGPAGGVGEEVVFVKGEGGVGGAELDEGGGGGFDGAANLCIEDGGEFGDVEVRALAGGVKAVVSGFELNAVGAVGGDGGDEVGVADQVVRDVVV